MKNKSYINPIIIAVALLVLSGCAPAGTAFLSPDALGLKGMYHKDGGEGVFENGTIKISVRHVRTSEYEGYPVLKSLSDKKYVILSVGIENRSKTKAIYNPSMTVLTDDGMDYRKPLDYTDLYDVVNGDSGLGNGLTAMNGKFYDLATTVQPGGRTSKLLIFEPLSKNARKADLAMNDIYVGTDTVNVRFPFVLDYSIQK